MNQFLFSNRWRQTPVLRRIETAVITTLFLLAITLITPALAQTDDDSPPVEPTKLIFIHHSCGQNLLTDGNGDLGRTLADNNYFVSDTNYGWGPDSIGNNTDITDWPTWFTGEESGRYLEALYNENEQHADYSRTFADPGGENQIIMFKSCYPNSNLAGSPDDPPQRGHGLTVGNAKAIYNELLTYFAAHPDKLFIAVTAPPVQDYTYAENARAFNTWLTTEWLQGYDGDNVAVFDFYNVLTGEENHHRFHEGSIQYITDQGEDVHAYPSGDDHPSSAGNRKATAEFVPLLNVYRNRWQGEDGPSLPVASLPMATEEVAAEPTTAPPQPEIAPSVSGGRMIDNFESDDSFWMADGDEDTLVVCGVDTIDAHSGSGGLRIQYDVDPDGWGACSRTYAAPRDWSDEGGITLFVRSAQVGKVVTITGLQGQNDSDISLFEYETRTTQDAVDGWQRIDFMWSDLVEPEWQGSGTAVFDPSYVIGIAFSFLGDDGDRNIGKLWVDDISFLLEKTPPPTEAEPPAPIAVEEESTPAQTAATKPAIEEEVEDSSSGLCPASMSMGVMALFATVWITTDKRRKGKQ